jgi:hypothetical protein
VLIALVWRICFLGISTKTSRKSIRGGRNMLSEYSRSKHVSRLWVSIAQISSSVCQWRVLTSRDFEHTCLRLRQWTRFLNLFWIEYINFHLLKEHCNTS